MKAVTPRAGRSVRGVPRDADATRVAILEAASRVLAEEGPAALTVRRIAAESGGSTMNVYSRFGGKDGVVDALFREGFQRLAASMVGAPDTDDPIDDLRRCARCYRRFALENPTYYAVMFDRSIPDFTPSPESMAVAHATLDLLQARTQRALDAGLLAGPSAADLAADLWAANHGIVSLELHEAGPDIDWEPRHRETIDAVLRGFGP